jgi:hypothetical protein
MKLDALMRAVLAKSTPISGSHTTQHNATTHILAPTTETHGKMNIIQILLMAVTPLPTHLKVDHTMDLTTARVTITTTMLGLTNAVLQLLRATQMPTIPLKLTSTMNTEKDLNQTSSTFTLPIKDQDSTSMLTSKDIQLESGTSLNPLPNQTHTHMINTGDTMAPTETTKSVSTNAPPGAAVTTTTGLMDMADGEPPKHANGLILLLTTTSTKTVLETATTLMKTPSTPLRPPADLIK